MGNVGGGIQFGGSKLSGFGTPATTPTRIVVRNCTVDGRGPIVRRWPTSHNRTHEVGAASRNGVLLSAGGYARNPAGEARLGAYGMIAFDNVVIKNTALEGILIEKKPKAGNLALRFTDVRLSQTAHSVPGAYSMGAPIY